MIINFYGIVTLVLMMIPNIIFYQKKKNMGTEVVHQSGFMEQNYRLKRQGKDDPGPNEVRKSTSIEIVESIGRYGCIFLMIINPGLYDYGFKSETAELWYYILSAALMMAYFAFWLILFKHDKKAIRLVIAILPCVIFAVNGVLILNPLLLAMNAIFAIAHIYITSKSTSAF